MLLEYNQDFIEKTEQKISNKEKLDSEEWCAILYDSDSKLKGNADCLKSAAYILDNSTKKDVVVDILNEFVKLRCYQDWEEGALGTPFRIMVYVANSNIPSELSKKIMEIANDLKIKINGKGENINTYSNQLDEILK